MQLSLVTLVFTFFIQTTTLTGLVRSVENSVAVTELDDKQLGCPFTDSLCSWYSKGGYGAKWTLTRNVGKDLVNIPSAKLSKGFLFLSSKMNGKGMDLLFSRDFNATINSVTFSFHIYCTADSFLEINLYLYEENVEKELDFYEFSCLKENTWYQVQNLVLQNNYKVETAKYMMTVAGRNSPLGISDLHVVLNAPVSSTTSVTQSHSMSSEGDFRKNITTQSLFSSTADNTNQDITSDLTTPTTNYFSSMTTKLKTPTQIFTRNSELKTEMMTSSAPEITSVYKNSTNDPITIKISHPATTETSILLPNLTTVAANRTTSTTTEKQITPNLTSRSPNSSMKTSVISLATEVAFASSTFADLSSSTKTSSSLATKLNTPTAVEETSGIIANKTTSSIFQKIFSTITSKTIQSTVKRTTVPISRRTTRGMKETVTLPQTTKPTDKFTSSVSGTAVYTRKKTSPTTPFTIQSTEKTSTLQESTPHSLKNNSTTAKPSSIWPSIESTIGTTTFHPVIIIKKLIIVFCKTCVM